MLIVYRWKGMTSKNKVIIFSIDKNLLLIAYQYIQSSSIRTLTISMKNLLASKDGCLSLLAGNYIFEMIALRYPKYKDKYEISDKIFHEGNELSNDISKLI